MTTLSFFIWSPDPDIFTIPWLDHPVRWYGLLFALGFLAAQQVSYWIYKKEGKEAKDVDQLTLYGVIAVVVGARLGHCLFYNPIHYLSNPLEILKIWEGGLASHGAAIGMFIAMYIYSRRHSHLSFRWLLDRMAIITVLIGAFIRFGNYVNSEIIGLPTETSNGIVFARSVEDLLSGADERIEQVSFIKGGQKESGNSGHVPMTILLQYRRGVELDPVLSKSFFESTLPNAFIRYYQISDHIYHKPGEKLIYNLYQSKNIQYAEIHVLGIPRHPAQLYEAIACVFMFLILIQVWYHRRDELKHGFIFGLFMVMLWTERFVDEFFKENQEIWEADIPLNMGQLLSIPMFLVGVAMMVKYWGKPEREA